MKHLIKVTKSHIHRGVRHATSSCPIALAVKDKFGPNGRIRILTNSVWIDTEKYYLTRSAQRFIQRFDEGKYCKPFNFYLTMP